MFCLPMERRIRACTWNFMLSFRQELRPSNLHAIIPSRTPAFKSSCYHSVKNSSLHIFMVPFRQELQPSNLHGIIGYHSVKNSGLQIFMLSFRQELQPSNTQRQQSATTTTTQCSFLCFESRWDCGHTMAQAVRRRVRTRVSLCGIRDGQSGTRTGFSPSSSVSRQYRYTVALQVTYHLGHKQ
jgi:hypothetical protein